MAVPGEGAVNDFIYNISIFNTLSARANGTQFTGECAPPGGKNFKKFL